MNLLAPLLTNFIGPKRNTTRDVAATAIGVIDTLFTSDEERLDKQALLARISVKADALQTAINASESKHKSIFVSGWRPFIGWVCGLALAWHFLFSPCFYFIYASLGIVPQTIPDFEMNELHTILFGLLGLGTLRTAEKAAGRA